MKIVAALLITAAKRLFVFSTLSSSYHWNSFVPTNAEISTYFSSAESDLQVDIGCRSLRNLLPALEISTPPGDLRYTDQDATFFCFPPSSFSQMQAFLPPAAS